MDWGLTALTSSIQCAIPCFCVTALLALTRSITLLRCPLFTHTHNTPPHAFFLFICSFLSCTADKMHLMSGHMMSRSLITLARCNQKPNASWLGLMAEESHYHLADLNPDQLANMIWGFAQLRYSPGNTWLQAVQTLSQQQLTGFSAQGLARLLQGLAGLRVRPEPRWLAAVGVVVQSRLRQLSGEELLQCVGALEVLGLAPAGVLVQQLSVGGLGDPTAAEAFAQSAASGAGGAVGEGGGSSSVAAADAAGSRLPTQQPSGTIQSAEAVADGSSTSGSNGAGFDHHDSSSSNGSSGVAGVSDSNSSSSELSGLLPRPRLPRAGLPQAQQL